MLSRFLLCKFSLLLLLLTTHVTAQQGSPSKATAQDRLLFAWVSNNGSFRSIIVVNNPTAEVAEIVLTARRSEEAKESVQRTVPAYGFLEEAADSLFPVLGFGSGYSVTVNSENTNLRGRWVTNSLTSASGASPSQGVAARIDSLSGNGRAGNDILFGYLPNNNGVISAPVIVSFENEARDVTAIFRNREGDFLGSVRLDDLVPKVPFAMLTSQLLPDTNEDVYMTIETSGQVRGSGPVDLTGVAFVFDPQFNEPAIGNAIRYSSRSSGSSGRLVYPWVSNRSGEYRSVLIADNLEGVSVEVTLRATRADGSHSEEVTRTIPRFGALQESADSLFPAFGDGPGYAVELTYDPDREIHGVWVTNNLAAASGASPSQGVAVASNNFERVGEHLLFGYLPLANGLISAPVIVNLGEASTDLVLKFYDAVGNLVASDNTSAVDLLPGVPFVALAATLVPADSGNLQMVASSSDGQPITGVAFVFNLTYFEPAIGNATAIEFTP